MKTKQIKTAKANSSSGLPIRPEQSSTDTAKAAEQSPTPTAGAALSSGGEGKGIGSIRPYVNFEERERNRQLPMDRVLAILKRWNPRQFDLAEVVGNWIWITFPEQPDERVRADLSQLGFHWNNTRKCWQHPCGQVTTRGQQDPRLKYGSRMAHAAAAQPA